MKRMWEQLFHGDDLHRCQYHDHEQHEPTQFGQNSLFSQNLTQDNEEEMGEYEDKEEEAEKEFINACISMMSKTYKAVKSNALLFREILEQGARKKK